MADMKAIRCKQEVTVQETGDKYAKGLHLVGTKDGQIPLKLAKRFVASPRLAVEYDPVEGVDVGTDVSAEKPAAEAPKADG